MAVTATAQWRTAWRAVVGGGIEAKEWLAKAAGNGEESKAAESWLSLLAKASVH